MKTRSSIIFYLNGERQVIDAGSAELAGETLAEFLRKKRALPGTKIVCAEGDCGACTVLRWYPYAAQKSEFVAINSCIALVAQMDGSALITVDALAEGEKLTPVQDQMVQCHASQCGFCTPGFVMALTGLVEKKLSTKSPSISIKDAQNATTGNLCRCTGYQSILDAACAIDLKKCQPVTPRFLTPAQIKDLKAVIKTPIAARGSDFTFHAPTTLTRARQLMKNGARLVAAGTDLGVVHNKRKIRLNQILSLHLIPELYTLRQKGGRVHVGARATLSELRSFTRNSVPEFSRFLDLFASPQIKNVATLVGNVANGSPIADTPPFLLVSGALVHLQGARGARKVPIERFYLAYRRTALRKGEFITGIEFDVPRDVLALYKVSQRKDLDISTVNAAFRIESKNGRIVRARFALGGVAAVPLRLLQTEKRLQGKTIEEAQATAEGLLQKEITPISDLRGSAALRRVLAGNLLAKFFRERLK